MNILVINAGSSSLKYQLINMTSSDVLAKGLCERIGIEGSRLQHTPAGGEKVILEKPMKSHADAIQMVIDALIDPAHGVISDMAEISAVGHRVVHGGEKFNASIRITEAVLKGIEECNDLAPLHNPPNIIGIRACEAVMPGVPQVAVFDTAFHQTMPPEAYLYALPYEYYTNHKVRRYGFHGTSHKYVSQRAYELLGKKPEDVKLITFHLGNGSSITAVDGGKSVDTSMGFTPLAGIPMGTRSGDIDSAIVGFIAEKEGMTAGEVVDVLNKKSGVLGVSGVSSDFRDLDAAIEEGNERAKIAIDLFEYQVRKYIGTYAAAMKGLDAIVFTAGIGENNCAMRERVLSGMSFMGIEIDPEKNKIRGQEIDISTPDAKVRVLVIPTNEEWMIAQETMQVLGE